MKAAPLQILVLCTLLPGLPAHAQQHPAAYNDGVADRGSWDDWFGDTGGDFHEGALYWFDHGTEAAASCTGANPPHPDQWVQGCQEAQQRLSRFYLRKRVDSEYRNGWTAEDVAAAAAKLPPPPLNPTMSPVLRPRRDTTASSPAVPAETLAVPPRTPVATAVRASEGWSLPIWPLVVVPAAFVLLAGLWKAGNGRRSK